MTKALPAVLNPAEPVGAIVYGVAIFIVGAILSWLIRKALKDALLHDKSERVNQITLQFVSRLLILLLWLFLIAFYAHLIPALNKVGTAILAGASLMSVIVGFAAQTTLGNLIGGVSLVLYKPFKKGDRIQVTAPTADQCETGVVEEVALGFTVLRTDDGRKVIIANGSLVQQTLIVLQPPSPPPRKLNRPTS
nr:mechanosensitive ion channel domain-containing protein [uncultured Sphingomonas sp.]